MSGGSQRTADAATPFETMAVVASREIRDGEVVFAGTGVPMIGAMLAQKTHAPECTLVFEAGAVAPRMHHLPMSVGDSRTLSGAAQAAGLFEIFYYLLQGGRIDVGFLGGAQIDRFGNINSTALGSDYRRPDVRLPGSGGGADVATEAGRTVIIARHERRRLVERVDYLTSPGWLDGGDSRERAGLRGGGPSALITTRGVIRYRDATREPYLASYHPGNTAREVAAETGFELNVAASVETAAPTPEELKILREVVDPERIFIGRTSH